MADVSDFAKHFNFEQMVSMIRTRDGKIRNEVCRNHHRELKKLLKIKSVIFVSTFVLSDGVSSRISGDQGLRKEGCTEHHQQPVSNEDISNVGV